MGLTLINTTGAISGGTGDVEITGLSSAYKAYEFHFYDLHLSATNANFEFQVNTSYNQDINSTAMRFYSRDHDTHDFNAGYQEGTDTPKTLTSHDLLVLHAREHRSRTSI